MSTILVLVLVLVFSFVVARLADRVASRTLILSGSQYVLVGLVLGPEVTDLASRQALAELQPFVSLVLGVVGFVLGLGLRRRLAATGRIGVGLLGGALTTALVSAAIYGLALAFAPVELHAPLFWVALALGCTAAVSEVAVVEEGARLFNSSGPQTDLLRSYAFAATLGAICTFGATLAVARAGDASNRLGLTMTEWLVASMAIGVACGVLFHLFIGREDDAQRTFLATVGVVTFASGLAAGVGVSPLFVNAIAGLTAAAISPAAGDLEPVLLRLERPALVMILVIAGASWRPATGLAWLVPVVYVVIRTVALRGAVPLAVRLTSEIAPGPQLGNALLAQGGMAAAIAVNLAQVQPSFHGLVLTAVLLSLLVNDLWSARALGTVLADTGEVRHAAPPERTEVVG